MRFFRKRYYMVFVKPAGTGLMSNTLAILIMYRCKQKQTGKKKFHLAHQLHKDYLMWKWQALFWWWMIRIRGRSNKNLFAYKFPKGRVFIRKCIIPL